MALLFAVKSETVRFGSQIRSDSAWEYCCACAGESFIASPAFSRHVPGYVFTTRDQGLGYYRDSDPSESQHMAAPADEASDQSVQQQQLSSRPVPFVFRPRLRTRAAAEELD